MQPATDETPRLVWRRKEQPLQTTGRKRKLKIADGVVNILQCNVTNWSDHARYFILTSDFDAALVSETHLEEAKLMAAVKEAGKSAWAGTGSAAISTANNGTSAAVLAVVRTRWYRQSLFYLQRRSWCSLFQCTVGGEGHSCHGQGHLVADSLF